MTQINTKSDRDRVRQRAGGAKQAIQQLRRVLREYREGRAASACMADLERLFKSENKA